MVALGRFFTWVYNDDVHDKGIACVSPSYAVCSVNALAGTCTSNTGDSPSKYWGAVLLNEM